MNVTFKFPPLKKNYVAVLSHQTLQENKTIFLNALMNNDLALQKIVILLGEILENSGDSSNQDQDKKISEFQRNTLSSIVHKLNLLLEGENEEENPREEQISSSTPSSTNSKLNETEQKILTNSLQFINSGEVISTDKEKLPISELNIQKNSAVLIVTINLKKGFELTEKETENQSPLTKRAEKMPEIFICKAHNIQMTHYCTHCSKLVCAFDLVTNNKQEIGCGKHIDKIVSLAEHQIVVENKISHLVHEFNHVLEQISTENQELESESNILMKKFEKNKVLFENIQETLKEITEISSINEANVPIHYEKLEKVMKLLPELKQMLQKSVVEKNEAFSQFEQQISAKNLIIAEVESKNANLSQKIVEKDQNIQLLKREIELQVLQKMNEIKVLQSKNAALTHKNFQNDEKIAELEKIIGQKNQKINGIPQLLYKTSTPTYPELLSKTSTPI